MMDENIQFVYICKVDVAISVTTENEKMSFEENGELMD